MIWAAAGSTQRLPAEGRGCPVAKRLAEASRKLPEVTADFPASASAGDCTPAIAAGAKSQCKVYEEALARLNKEVHESSTDAGTLLPGEAPHHRGALVLPAASPAAGINDAAYDGSGGKAAARCGSGLACNMGLREKRVTSMPLLSASKAQCPLRAVCDPAVYPDLPLLGERFEYPPLGGSPLAFAPDRLRELKVDKNYTTEPCWQGWGNVRIGGTCTTWTGTGHLFDSGHCGRLWPADAQEWSGLRGNYMEVTTTCVLTDAAMQKHLWRWNGRIMLIFPRTYEAPTSDSEEATERKRYASSFKRLSDSLGLKREALVASVHLATGCQGELLLFSNRADAKGCRGTGPPGATRPSSFG
ncbi:hypothetical protein WJX81_007926 [Elliptochloris bilobata]|uniref:Uncharacterized protein n=1 Tax=Elliptochloris bilobata TaxID=381761 RepID=A0AAW1S1M0_9CHLO